jgi:hypothetical protein
MELNLSPEQMEEFQIVAKKMLRRHLQLLLWPGQLQVRVEGSQEKAGLKLALDWSQVCSTLCSISITHAPQ